MEHEIAAAIRNASQAERANVWKLELQKNSAETGRLIVLILAVINVAAGAMPILGVFAILPLAASYFADTFALRGDTERCGAFSIASIAATVALVLLTLFNAW